MATKHYNGWPFIGPYPGKSAEAFTKGQMVGMKTGVLEVATTTTGLYVLGLASDSHEAANNGAVTVDTRPALFKIGAAAEALVLSDVGVTVYAIDHETVGKVATSKSAAGTLLNIIAINGTNYALVKFATS